MYYHTHVQECEIAIFTLKHLNMPFSYTGPGMQLPVLDLLQLQAYEGL